ncbi:hypothetical protein KHX94_10825 [Shewanella dokdonensis]|uniref:Uncharacterized protein n=1 Tax=Shewanella dokdonensis TaxID=712036 RepID=A0ABX8DAU0_9GAMM|nr:hypothetical protein [Shewanella dokdonensis]QVK21983.1 hypothetical protein KHX94_10825 [Shewanella dokdonensis]
MSSTSDAKQDDNLATATPSGADGHGTAQSAAASSAAAMQSSKSNAGVSAMQQSAAASQNSLGDISSAADAALKTAALASQDQGQSAGTRENDNAQQTQKIAIRLVTAKSGE